MNIELITERESLPALASRWDQLAANDSRDGYFRTYGWYQSWLEHIRPEAEPFVIVVRDFQNRIIGLAPLCRTSYYDLGFRLTAISWAGREVVSGDFLDVVCEREATSEVVSAVLKYLSENQAKCSLLVMGELTEGGLLHGALAKLAQQRLLPLRYQEERICPYIALPGSFEEYLGHLSSSTRYHVRRRTRDIEKRGAQIITFSEPSDIASGLDILTRLHLKRWRKDNLPGTLARPGFAAFLHQICSNPPVRSSARLYLMTYNGSAVAALLMFYFGQSALYYQAGWDPDSSLASLSPGVVLMARSISDAIQSGFRFFEFLRGDEEYKSHWTNSCRRTLTVLMGTSFWGREYLRAASLKDRLKGRLMAEHSRASAFSDHWVINKDPYAAT